MSTGAESTVKLETVHWITTLKFLVWVVTVPGYSTEFIVTVNGCVSICEGNVIWLASTVIVEKSADRLINDFTGVRVAEWLQTSVACNA